MFGINDLGQWSIWRLEAGIWYELRNLPGEAWTDTEVVLGPRELSRLQVEANGPELRLLVNDHLLTEEPIVGPTFVGGGIGFYVASSQTAGEALARVQFDNLSVTPLSVENSDQ